MFYKFKTVSHLVSLTFFFCLLDTDSFSCSEHGHPALCVIHLFNQCVFLMLEGGPENCTTEKITQITDYYLGDLLSEYASYGLHIPAGYTYVAWLHINTNTHL